MHDSVDADASTQNAALGVVASSLAAFGWGCAIVLAGLTSVSGIVVAFWRMWLGAAVLIIGLALRRRRITLRTLRIAWPGGLLLAADMTLFFTAIKFAGVAVPTVIGALQPALVMVAARFMFGDRFSRWNIVWTAVAIVGVAVIAVGGGEPTSHQVWGDILAIASLCSWTGYFLAAKRAQPLAPALDYTAAVTLVASMASCLTVLVFRADIGGVGARDWGWIVLLAFVPSIAHLLMNWAHQHLDVSIASLIGSANPIVAAVGAYLFLHQGLTWVQILGGAAGLVAIGVVAVNQGRPATPPSELTSDPA